MIGAVLIERRQGNRRDADLAHQTLGKVACGLVADPIVACKLEVAAGTRKEGERRSREERTQKVALCGEECGQRFVALRPLEKFGKRMLNRAVDGEDNELVDASQLVGDLARRERITDFPAGRVESFSERAE